MWTSMSHFSICRFFLRTGTLHSWGIAFLRDPRVRMPSHDQNSVSSGTEYAWGIQRGKGWKCPCFGVPLQQFRHELLPAARLPECSAGTRLSFIHHRAQIVKSWVIFLKSQKKWSLTEQATKNKESVKAKHGSEIARNAANCGRDCQGEQRLKRNVWTFGSFWSKKTDPRAGISVMAQIMRRMTLCSTPSPSNLRDDARLRRSEQYGHYSTWSKLKIHQKRLEKPQLRDFKLKSSKIWNNRRGVSDRAR